MKKVPYIYLLLIIVLMAGTSCKKGFLDVKPDKSLVVPHTLADLRALLDNTTVMNTATPYLGEAGSDDYYLTDDSWQTLVTADSKNAYIWAKDIYEGNPAVLDWVNRYRQVFYANIALEGLDSLSAAQGNTADYRSTKGAAYFYRALAFYQLAQVFSKPYGLSAATDPGIPLKLRSDINAKTTRPSVMDTYAQILSDLNSAVPLLPLTETVKTRPTRPAAFALIAKTLLLMQNYAMAAKYADSCISLSPKLIDYNTMSATANIPFPRFNDEVIFHSKMISTGIFSTSRLIVDTTLYRSYAPNDLRKTVFFKVNGKTQSYKGSYEGSATFFSGIAADELYLLRAEANARLNNVSRCLEDLNTVLIRRYKKGTFVPLTASGMKQALALVLQERRKELLFRGIRWEELRRLNRDPDFAITLTRHVNGQTYTLPPNSPLYVLPIPENVIVLSGIPQNER